MIKIPEGVLTKRHSLFRILNLLTQFSLNNTEKDNLMGTIAVPEPTLNLSWIYSGLFIGPHWGLKSVNSMSKDNCKHRQELLLQPSWPTPDSTPLPPALI